MSGKRECRVLLYGRDCDCSCIFVRPECDGVSYRAGAAFLDVCMVAIAQVGQATIRKGIPRGDMPCAG